MEPLVLKQRQPVEDVDVEAWDDDDFDGLDDVQIRTASTATSVMSHPQTGHRDSISSRLSVRSDSNQGDENWDVLVDEQSSIKDAIALAKSKGIPLPSNVPRSALEGGTIRRLKGKEIKKAIADDWSEDLDMPSANGPLKLAKHDDRDFSESLRQISAAFHSSPKSPDLSLDLNKTIRSPKARTAAAPVSLDAFRDEEEEDYFDVPTIRVAKHRSPQKTSIIDNPVPVAKPDVEGLEEDLELPADGQLKLSTKKPLPRTPQQTDDFDFEWGEGSLGTRNAGRRGQSARSSSVSALSPSVSSAFTAESEDDGLDGLVLPEGSIKFGEKLKVQQAKEKAGLAIQVPKFAQPQPTSKPRQVSEDFFEDFDIGDGDVFDSAKLTLNRNVKQKSQRPTSPSKRTTTTLNFTSTKTQGTISRLPRFQSSHDRARSNLEPVSESGAPVSRFQRPGSRLGHSAQSSVSSIPTPTTPTPSTPSRRGLRPVESRIDMRYQPPTTTNAQLLRAKRSMPVISGLNSPTKPPAYTRPPSRQEAGSRLNTYERPESRLGEARKGALPFLPAGAHGGQSQHVSIKTTTTARHYRRQDSDGSGESMTAAQRSLSRIAGLGRPETPGKGRSSMTTAELAAQAKKQMTKPARRRNYGDGTELEIFDDLPTSASTESKFTKAPIGRGAPRSLRSKLGLSQLNPSTTSLASTLTRGGTETPLPSTPLSPPRQDFPTTATTLTNIPRFARDTAASRNARQQRQISTTFQNIHGEPLQPITSNYKLNIQPAPAGSAYNSLRKKKNAQQKPHLIKPMGGDMNRPKEEKGMHYNPALYRWEGNENALAPFDVPDFHPRQGSPLGAKEQGSPSGKANVALITNMGNVSGVQVVGGMVFDPRQMRWLKMAEQPKGASATLRGGGEGDVLVEEEEDVFAGLEDLKEEDEFDAKSHRSSAFAGGQQYGNLATTPRERVGSMGSMGSGEQKEKEGEDSSDEYGGGVAEEFDVGPEFVRRQKSEEERWKRKVEKWLRVSGQEQEEDAMGYGGWRWAIRDLVREMPVS